MKYWLLTTEYPPFFGGGIGTYAAITAKTFAENGNDVTVFINDMSVTNVEISKLNGIRIIRFNQNRTKSFSFLGHTTNLSFEYANILKETIQREGKPDIIEAQEYLGIAYYLLQFKKLLYDWCRDIPVVITMHSPSFLYMEYNHVSEYKYPNYWICEMERFCLQAADQIISPSQFMIDELAKRFKLRNQSLVIIRNPYESKTLDTEPSKSGNEIIFYGKLTVQKGAFKLLAYFKRLWDEGFDRPLIVIGGQDIVYHPEGISMGDLIRKKYEYYIGKGLLRLQGSIQPSEINDRLKLAEVIIIPSNNDNLPYVAFETMSLAKVLLVSKQGGHAEIIEDGLSGFIFDHNYPDSFGIALKKILALSEADKKRIANSAKERVSEVADSTKIYQEKIKLFTSLITTGKQQKVYPFIRIETNNSVRATEVNGKLSVVIPYYNMGKYIDETIASVRRSEYGNKEILIINDGSTDKLSLEKLAEIRSQADIKVIDSKNGGLAKARNLGAAVASGEYLAFLDADDLIDKTYYTKAIVALSWYENLSFVGSWVQYFENSKVIWPAFSPEPPLILYHNTVNSSSLVYKRSSFLAAGENDSDMIFQGLEDYDSVISMVSAGFGGIVIPEPLFHYRIRHDSMIRHINKEKKLFLYEYITRKHKRSYNNFAPELFSFLNANGSPLNIDNPSLDYHLLDKMPFKGKLANRAIRIIKRNPYLQKLAYNIYKRIKK